MACSLMEAGHLTIRLFPQILILLLDPIFSRDCLYVMGILPHSRTFTRRASVPSPVTRVRVSLLLAVEQQQAVDNGVQESGILVVHLLMRCMEAIQRNDLKVASDLVMTVNSAPCGAMGNVASHFVEALT